MAQNTANDQTKSFLTMEDLLSQSEYKLSVPKAGDIIQGKVAGVTKKMVLVDVGGKTEGLVVDKEFQQAVDFISELKIGDTVDVYVLDGENEQGQILLSLKKAAMDKKWDEFIKIMEEQTTIQVKAIDVNRGGMVVMLEGVRGFIPTSQFGRAVSGKLPVLKGKDLDVKLIEVDKEKNRLIFSERLVSEADEIANSSAALDAVKEGAIVKGTITGIKPFGIFVAVEVEVAEEKEGKAQLGVLEGLVHISEVAWDKVDDLQALYKKGQEIETKVLLVDKEQSKLTLSIKQLQGDPWEKLEQECPAGSTITGTVSRVVPFGVFVTIASGVDGLIHESKLNGTTYFEGEKVSVVIDSIDTDQRRVSLSPTASELPVNYK